MQKFFYPIILICGSDSTSPASLALEFRVSGKALSNYDGVSSCIGNYRSLLALQGRRKNQPQSTQRPQRFFFVKTKTQIILWKWTALCLSILRGWRQEDERRGSRERRVHKLECWNLKTIGTLEYWNDGIMGLSILFFWPIISIFHSSIIPFLDSLRAPRPLRLIFFIFQLETRNPHPETFSDRLRHRVIDGGLGGWKGG
jgi:hypothetical protein